MGKHHWKVEKQPEWYVKAVRKTIAALPGGYAEAAEWLDVTENALFNRLRADGDQIFPLGWAMILQRAAGTHYIADAVAQSAGGVFVSLPEIEEVENADINQRLLEVIEQIGSYSKQIRSAIEDGVVEPDDGSERLVSTARTTETTYRFTQLALGNYRLTVRAANAWGQQGDPASVSFRIAAPAAPSRIELTPGYFQITATPHLAVYDPTVQFEFWFSEKRIADIRQVETTARYLGTALYWIAASINIKPGHDYYFYRRFRLIQIIT